MSIQDKKPDVPVSECSNLVIVTTPEYVKKAIEEHAQSRNHPYATQAEPGLVTLSNDVNSDSEITVATSKAVKKAYDLANTANQNATKPQTKGSIKSVSGSWGVNSTIFIPADLRGQVITFVRLEGLNARHQALPVPLVDGITEQRLAGPNNYWVWLEFKFSDNSTHITVINGRGANFIQIFYRE
ncbi:tail fiber protein [Xenorhabdus sp. PB62.4]|uniref:tail fiber protein n=1 Tax=Xenorhabdus sp. PB62.4 TaxID=1851573 RepID=UPI001CA3EBB8|nr:tail fiber protein [Xenorhabdus sp. PB62.4]MBC8952535.1 tail protein [Xenorhabdus sp. PB62.4]